MKAKTKKNPIRMDLMQLFERFGTEKQCREALEQMRWPDGVKCLRCQSEKVYRIHTRDLFRDRKSVV